MTDGTFEEFKIKENIRLFDVGRVLYLDSVSTKLDVRKLLETEEGQLISNGFVYMLVSENLLKVALIMRYFQ